MLPGIQISSFRPLTKTEEGMRETFRRAAALGCRHVQLQWIDPSIPAEKIAEALKEAGLVSVSVQDYYDSVVADEEYYLRLNGETGGRWLCVSRIPERMKSPEGLDRFVRELRRLGEAAKDRGQALCYHPVAPDYPEIGGKCPVEVLLERLPELRLCLDLCHLDKAGYDLPAWIGAHAGRVDMVHFKDEKDGRLVPAGQGDVRYAGAVRACLRAGVAYGFAEQEAWEGDPFVRIGEALDWLRGELAAEGDAGA